MIEITKQDMLILLLNGGILEKKLEGTVEPFQKLKVLDKVNYPRLVKIFVKTYFTDISANFLIGYNKEAFIPADFFLEKEYSFYKAYYKLYKIPIHPKQEFFVNSSLMQDGPSSIKFSLAVFTLPEYILEAPSIKQVEIQNTFNIPLEEQNVR